MVELKVIGVSPVTTYGGSQAYCRALGGQAGWEKGYHDGGTPCGGKSNICYAEVSAVPTGVQLPISSLMGLGGSIEEGAIQGTPSNVVPTSSTTALISGGVADKLRDAGFSESVIEPLEKTGWSQGNVDELIAEANAKGITAPSQINPSTLIVTPAGQSSGSGLGLGIIAIIAVAGLLLSKSK
jgi:hypothetical protein